MHQDELEVLRRKTGEEAGRDQDDGLEEADDHGDIGQIGFQSSVTGRETRRHSESRASRACQAVEAAAATAVLLVMRMAASQAVKLRNENSITPSIHSGATQLMGRVTVSVASGGSERRKTSAV